MESSLFVLGGNGKFVFVSTKELITNMENLFSVACVVLEDVDLKTPLAFI